MEIQLTKTKTITIGGMGGGKKKRKPADVVGVDLFSGDSRGCPAIRLVEKKGVLRLMAVGFVPPPADPLPDSWESAAKGCAWSLPPPFQAPRAALAVTSPDMFFAQTTAEAFRSDLAAGSHRNEEPSRPKGAKLGIIRKDDPSRKEVPAPAGKPAEGPSELQTLPGIPVSNGGTRFVMKPMPATDGFVMEAGLPEYQALWLSRLLPEGRRPTAASIQLRPSALSASVLRQEAFLAAGGSALTLFIADDAISIAGYKEGDLVLWRTCRGVSGWRAIRESLQKGLGLDEAMLASVLDDDVIDPRPVLEPLLSPILDELAVSRDYLVGKLGVKAESTIVLGLPVGGRYIADIAENRLRLKLVFPSAFDGIVRADKHYAGEGAALDGAGTNAFLGALGAALALIGEEAGA